VSNAEMVRVEAVSAKYINKVADPAPAEGGAL
jgi:hypothetical protein